MSLADSNEPFSGVEDRQYELREFIPRLAQDRFRESRGTVLVNTARLLVPSIVAEADRLRDAKRARGLAHDAMSVVADLDFHLHPWEEDSDTRKRWQLWRHLPASTISDPSSEKHAIDKEGFELAVGAYLARPWMQHDHIDWCIADALAAHEWIAYLHHVRTERAARRFVRMFQVPAAAAIFGLPLWGVIHLFETRSSWAGPALLAYGALLAWEAVSMVRRRIARLRNQVPAPSRLLRAMAEAYATLDGAVLSPTKVAEALRAADAKGVSWPPAIWPVIDAAVARNPSLWRVAPTS